MKNIFEAVIKRGKYDISVMLEKIDIYHIEGKLTDSERDYLYAYAMENHKPNNYEQQISELQNAVKELQEKVYSEI